MFLTTSAVSVVFFEFLIERHLLESNLDALDGGFIAIRASAYGLVSALVWRFYRTNQSQIDTFIRTRRKDSLLSVIFGRKAKSKNDC
jgi:hypothetical protein